MPADGQTFAHSVDRDESQVGERLLAGRSAFLGFLIKRLGNRTDAEAVLQDFCVRVLSRTVRRQSFWDRLGPDLREGQAHLFG